MRITRESNAFAFVQGNPQSKGKLIEALASKNNEAKILDAFNSYDTDKSGFLNKKEFSHFAEDLVKIMTQGGIDAKALLGGMSSKEFADTMFAGIDLDNNGKISYTEFRAAIQKSA
jgi:Ca2+-binding EF-hand superfamily protein